MIHAVATILALSGCPTPEDSAAQWKDEISAIHASAKALEVDLKEKVVSTSYTLRMPVVDGVYRQATADGKVGSTSFTKDARLYFDLRSAFVLKHTVAIIVPS